MKATVSRKEFLDLKNKIDQIHTAVTCQKPLQIPSTQSTQSLDKRLTYIEQQEKWVAGRIDLRVEMGIRQLDQQRQEDHKQFIKKTEDLIFEGKELKDQLVKITNEQDEN